MLGACEGESLSAYTHWVPESDQHWGAARALAADGAERHACGACGASYDCPDPLACGAVRRTTRTMEQTMS